MSNQEILRCAKQLINNTHSCYCKANLRSHWPSHQLPNLKDSTYVTTCSYTWLRLKLLSILSDQLDWCFYSYTTGTHRGVGSTSIVIRCQLNFVELLPHREAITGRQSGMTTTDLDKLTGSKFLLTNKIHLWFELYTTVKPYVKKRLPKVKNTYNIR